MEVAAEKITRMKTRTDRRFVGKPADERRFSSISGGFGDLDLSGHDEVPKGKHKKGKGKRSVSIPLDPHHILQPSLH